MTIYGLDIPMELVNTLRVVVGLIVLDALLGVALAVKRKEFDWEKLPQFLATNIFPYVGGILATGLAAVVAGGKDVPELFYAVGAIASARYLKSCRDKAVQLLGNGTQGTGGVGNGTQNAGGD